MKTTLAFLVILFASSSSWLYYQLRQDTNALLTNEVRCVGGALSDVRSTEQILLAGHIDPVLESIRADQEFYEHRLEEIVALAHAHAWKISDVMAIADLAERYRTKAALKFLPAEDAAE